MVHTPNGPSKHQPVKIGSASWEDRSRITPCPVITCAAGVSTTTMWDLARVEPSYRAMIFLSYPSDSQCIPIHSDCWMTELNITIMCLGSLSRSEFQFVNGDYEQIPVAPNSSESSPLHQSTIELVHLHKLKIGVYWSHMCTTKSNSYIVVQNLFSHLGGHILSGQIIIIH